MYFIKYKIIFIHLYLLFFNNINITNIIMEQFNPVNDRNNAKQV